MQTGLDRLLVAGRRLRGRRYGLLCHAASVTHDLIPAHVALARLEEAGPRILFGPEHGLYGVEQDMVPSSDATEPGTGLPILSLYGSSYDSLRPPPEALEEIDLLVIDVQDVGSRYYTYAATAVWAAEVALEHGCEVWVLDRPNPIGGRKVEGNLLEDPFTSFVGAFRLPARHGLTLGELFMLEARRRNWHAEGLEIWRLEGWRREMSWSETGRPWIAPSPNMPTPTSALIYPGGCLVEGTVLSEGRGTTRPFQLVGAPGVDAYRLSRVLNDLGLPGARFLPTYFRPQFHKHAGVVCGGVEVVITDAATVRPYRCGLELLRAFHDLTPEAFGWRREAYEFVQERPAIDLLTGSDRFRLGLDGRPGELEEWLGSFADDEAEFRAECRDVLLYS